MMLGRPDKNDNPVLMFTNPPNYSEICSVNLLVANNSGTNGPASKNQAHILKCREIIFTEPDVLCTPSFNNNSWITMVLQKQLFKTGRLHERFKKIGLQVSEPKPVTPALYQACLTYTLLAKLAPNWNKAGQWLLQGRDFLVNTSCINAIKMSLTVTSNDITMALQATALRSTSFQLHELNLSPSLLQEFRLQPDKTIDERFLMNTWCHVLPSMKKGKLVSISKTIPVDSPFKTYRDFKRHWKNTYGYRLPESETDILYYQIYFKPIGHILFTYPDVCLRSRDFHFLPRVDPKPILTQFLQDVAAKMSSVCGQNLNLQPKAKYAKLGLNCASQNLANSNLTSKVPRTHVTLRDPVKLENMYKAKGQSEERTNVKEVPGPSKPIDRIVSQQEPYQRILNQGTIKETSSRQAHIVNSTGKIVPLFKSKTVPQVTAKTITTDQTLKRVTPIFRAKSVASSKPSENPVSRTASFTPQKRPILTSKTVSRDISTPSQTDSFVPTVARKLFERNISDGKSSQYQPEKATVWNPGQKSTPIFLQIPGDLNEDDFQLPRIQTPILNTPQPSQLKRKMHDIDSPSVKKSRSKPQVQSGIDVKSLAQQNQLSKVNAPTLAAWLKDHNVQYKTKDKKTDLMDKVYQYLLTSSAEP